MGLPALLVSTINKRIRLLLFVAALVAICLIGYLSVKCFEASEKASRIRSLRLRPSSSGIVIAYDYQYDNRQLDIDAMPKTNFRAAQFVASTLLFGEDVFSPIVAAWVDSEMSDKDVAFCLQQPDLRFLYISGDQQWIGRLKQSGLLNRPLEQLSVSCNDCKSE